MAILNPVLKPVLAPIFSLITDGRSRGASSLAMPSGALGIWYAEEYQTSPRPYVPNAAATVGAPRSLITATRRLFSNTTYYNKNEVTVTDAAATAPDASMDASTVAWGSADGYVRHIAISTLPAGTYTLTVDVCTTDAATVGFRMGPSASMTSMTATPSWQSFSVTFAQVSGDPALNIVRAINSTTPANLKICNARLHAGAVDLGVEPWGNMVFSLSSAANQPTVAGGIITMNANGKFGFVQIPTTTLTAFTTFAVSRRKATAGGNPNYQAYLSKIQNYGDFSALHCSPKDQEGTCFNGNADIITDYPGLWQWQNDQWHIMAARYDGTKHSVWMDGVKAVEVAQAGASRTVADLAVGYIAVPAYFAKYDLNAIAMYNRALTTAEMVEAFAHLKERAGASSLATGNNRWLCAEGDSITYGTGSPLYASYARLFGVNSSPAVNGHISAYPGSTLNTGVHNLGARAPVVDAMIPARKMGRQFVLSILIGANDVIAAYSGMMTQYAADVGTYCLARKAAGWDKVVLATITPGVAAGRNTGRAVYNAIITAPGWAAANGVDAICDFAADPTIGTDAAASDITLYPDGLHPSDACYIIMETIYRATINAL